MSNTQMIDHCTLSHLIEAGAVREVDAIGQVGGWALVVKYGNGERTLAAQRTRQPRLFKRLETLVVYLQDIGIRRFTLDSSQYDPGSVKTVSRPDRSEALKEAHRAAAYASWLRAQVESAGDAGQADVAERVVKAPAKTKPAATRKPQKVSRD